MTGRGITVAVGLLTCVLLAGTAATPAGPCPDADQDGICDAADSCPTVPNPRQAEPTVIVSGTDFDVFGPGYVIAPGDQHLVYRTGSAASPGLASAPLTGGAAATLIANGSLGELLEWRVSTDGARVLVRARPEGNPARLFAVPIDGGPAVTLNGELVPGGEVTGFAVCPDGATLVYRADQETDQVFEIYRVPAAGGQPVKLNGALVAGGSVSDFILAPDCSRVVYRADQTTDGVLELFSVPLGGGEPVRLNPPLEPDEDVGGYTFDPQSTRVSLNVRNIMTGSELSVVPAAGGPPVLLIEYDTIDWFSFTPDGQRVILRRGIALWSVPVTTGWPDAIQLTQEASGAAVPPFGISPNSALVVFKLMNSFMNSELLHVVPVTGGPVLQLNATRPPQFGRTTLPYTGIRFADSTRLLFGQEVSITCNPSECPFRVWSVPLAPPDPNAEVLLSSYGHSFDVTPDGQRVVFDSIPFDHGRVFHDDLFGEALTAVSAPPDPSAFFASLTSDGTTVVYRTAAADIRQVSLDGTDMDGADTDGDGSGGACDCDDLDPSCSATCPDGDGDGLAVCQGDCDPACMIVADCADADPSVPGPEINDGQDNQCPGADGHGLVDELGPTLRFVDPESLCWDAQPGATSYERASASSASFSAGCATTTTSDICSTIAETPAPGAALYLLVRPFAPHPGSWGAGASGERVVPCASN